MSFGSKETEKSSPRKMFTGDMRKNRGSLFRTNGNSSGKTLLAENREDSCTLLSTLYCSVLLSSQVLRTTTRTATEHYRGQPASWRVFHAPARSILAAPRVLRSDVGTTTALHCSVHASVAEVRAPTVQPSSDSSAAASCVSDSKLLLQRSLLQLKATTFVEKKQHGYAEKRKTSLTPLKRKKTEQRFTKSTLTF